MQEAARELACGRLVVIIVALGVESLTELLLEPVLELGSTASRVIGVDDAVDHGIGMYGPWS